MNQKTIILSAAIVATAMCFSAQSYGQDAASLNRAIEVAKATGRPIFGHAGTET